MSRCEMGRTHQDIWAQKPQTLRGRRCPTWIDVNLLHKKIQSVHWVSGVVTYSSHVFWLIRLCNFLLYFDLQYMEHFITIWILLGEHWVYINQWQYIWQLTTDNINPSPSSISSLPSFPSSYLPSCEGIVGDWGSEWVSEGVSEGVT